MRPPRSRLGDTSSPPRTVEVVPDCRLKVEPPSGERAIAGRGGNVGKARRRGGAAQAKRGDQNCAEHTLSSADARGSSALADP